MAFRPISTLGSHNGDRPHRSNHMLDYVVASCGYGLVRGIAYTHGAVKLDRKARDGIVLTSCVSAPALLPLYMQRDVRTLASKTARHHHAMDASGREAWEDMFR